MYVRPAGGITKVDTAPLTGEPLPWSVPRKDKDGEPGSGKVTVEESVGGYEKTLSFTDIIVHQTRVKMSSHNASQ